jgi:hypothetical protein
MPLFIQNDPATLILMDQAEGEGAQGLTWIVLQVPGRVEQGVCKIRAMCLIYRRRTIDEEVIDRISGSETNLLLVVHSKANSRMNIAYRHPCCIDYPT